MMEMSSSVFVTAKTKSSTWRRNTSGRSRFRSSKAWSRCMSCAFCIEIWNRQTSSCIKMAQRSLVISMWARWLRRVFSTRRRERRTTRVLRCGRTNPMIWSLTFGRSVALSTKCARWCPHSVPTIWTVFTNECSKGSTLLFRPITAWTCVSWSKPCCKWIPNHDLTPKNCWTSR